MYASFTGNSTKNIFEKLKVQFNLTDDVATLVETKRNLFNDAFDSKEDLYLLEGVEDLIKEIKRLRIENKIESKIICFKKLKKKLFENNINENIVDFFDLLIVKPKKFLNLNIVKSKFSEHGICFKFSYNNKFNFFKHLSRQGKEANYEQKLFTMNNLKNIVIFLLFIILFI